MYLPRHTGNLVCNDETNNADCDYDGGDCCVSTHFIHFLPYQGKESLTFGPNFDHCSECVCATTGVIMSPRFPEDYANGLEVSWLILVFSGQVIELNFISFDVEDGWFPDDHNCE